MKIEDQVCTVSQAKKLKECGIAQTSFFYWNCLDEFDNIPPARYSLMQLKGINFHASAFTVAELGTMLPTAFDTMRLTEERGNELWKPYDDHDNDVLGSFIFFKTEAKARAAMLIYLLGKGIVIPSEVNQRLLNA